jgi:hypothetical protein
MNDIHDPFHIEPDDSLLDLQFTLMRAKQALVRAHPELGDAERPYWLPPPPACTSSASVLIGLADILGRAVEHYFHARDVGDTSRD